MITTELKPVRTGFLPVLNSESQYAIRTTWIDDYTLIVGYAPDRIDREQVIDVIRWGLDGRPLIDIDDPHQALADHIDGGDAG